MCILDYYNLLNKRELNKNVADLMHFIVEWL